MIYQHLTALPEHKNMTWVFTLVSSGVTLGLSNEKRLKDNDTNIPIKEVQTSSKREFEQ